MNTENPSTFFKDMSEKAIEMSEQLELPITSTGVQADKELVDNAMMRIDFLSVSMKNILDNTFALIMEQKRNGTKRNSNA